jgi:hypothetical protein
MEDKLMMTFGYQITSEQDVKTAFNKFKKQHPEVNWDGATRKMIVNMYKNRTKPYRHVVFFQIEDKWFLRFLVDNEVIHHIPLK